MEKLRYTIEQRLPGGAWNHKSDCGCDEAYALRNARWFRQILRVKVDYRVCACVGEERAVILGEVSS